jgi:hypothetical protein
MDDESTCQFIHLNECTHSFHKDCLLNNEYYNGKRCPLCRTNYTNELRNELQIQFDNTMEDCMNLIENTSLGILNQLQSIAAEIIARDLIPITDLYQIYNNHQVFDSTFNYEEVEPVEMTN